MKRILKITYTFFLILIFIASCPVTVQALESNIDQYNEEFDLDTIISATDEETLGILKELGIDSLSFESLFSVSPTKNKCKHKCNTML